MRFYHDAQGRYRGMSYGPGWLVARLLGWLLVLGWPWALTWPWLAELAVACLWYAIVGAYLLGSYTARQRTGKERP